MLYELKIHMAHISRQNDTRHALVKGRHSAINYIPNYYIQFVSVAHVMNILVKDDKVVLDCCQCSMLTATLTA